MVAAGADVPGFGDELPVPQHRVLRDGREQRCRGIEAVVAPDQCGGEVETEAVDAGGERLMAERVHGQAQRGGTIQCQRVAAAGVVDVARRVVGRSR